MGVRKARDPRSVTFPKAPPRPRALTPPLDGGSLPAVRGGPDDGVDHEAHDPHVRPGRRRTARPHGLRAGRRDQRRPRLAELPVLGVVRQLLRPVLRRLLGHQRAVLLPPVPERPQLPPGRPAPRLPPAAATSSTTASAATTASHAGRRRTGGCPITRSRGIAGRGSLALRALIGALVSRLRRFSCASLAAVPSVTAGLRGRCGRALALAGLLSGAPDHSMPLPSGVPRADPCRG